MVKNTDQTYMKTQPVLRLLLTMALPMVISMLVNSLYNIVDSFFVAKISKDAMTALSLVYPMQNLINAVMIGFGVGINAVISFYLGAQNQEKADRAATQGVILSTIHGILLMVFCLLTIHPFLKLFTSDTTTIQLGLQYSHIVFAFSVMFAWELVFEKVFQAVGRMAVSMVCMMIGCIANIILDPILIFGLGPFPRMEIKGAALATGLGQTISALSYVVIYFCRPLSVRIRRDCVRPDRRICRKLYAIGIPASLNLALPSLLISSLNVILTAYSQTYVFILGVYYKLQTFLYLTANGVIQGMRPLLSYNYGAGEHVRVRNIFKDALIIVFLILLGGMLLCLTIPQQLMGLFSNNPDTIRSGALALRIISAGFITSSLSVTASGALEALGKGLSSLIISLCRYAVLIIPIAFITSRFLGAVGVWHAFWIAEALTAVLAVLIFGHTLKQAE